MAKANNHVTQGLQRKIVVHSKRYGDHERNPRGTFKPAVLNQAMEQSKNRLLQVNQTASLIFSGIRDEHRDGTLWPRLLSALRCQLKETNHNDVNGLLNLECHAVHTLQNIVRSYLDIEIGGIVKRQLPISVCLDKAPRWRTKHIDGIQVSMHVIYPDLARNRIQKEVVKSEVLPTTGFPEEIPFAIPVPAHAPAYAVFCKITGCIKGIPGERLQSTGMRCVAVGLIPGKQRPPAKRKTIAKKKQPVARKHKARH
jgi:hypothetical protein